MKVPLTFIAASVLALSLTASVSAKSLSRMVAETGLSPEDFNILTETARPLYETASPRAGATASWDNPDSGNRGVVRLDSLSGGCAVLTHQVYAKGATEPRAIRSRRCKSAEGKWLLAP